MITKYRNEKSEHGHRFSTLKSAIQKYIRRNEIDKGMYCINELLKFNKMIKIDPKNTKRIMTNIANRIVVIANEDIGIGQPSKLIFVCQCYKNWLDDRSNIKFLRMAYLSLFNSQNKTRLPSYIRHLYLHDKLNTIQNRIIRICISSP
ncbi:MAG: hypothetical protein ACYTFK_14150, partial [Planctomycetota bacterium]